MEELNLVGQLDSLGFALIAAYDRVSEDGNNRTKLASNNDDLIFDVVKENYLKGFLHGLEKSASTMDTRSDFCELGEMVIKEAMYTMFDGLNDISESNYNA
jgi:hypothetical protein